MADGGRGGVGTIRIELNHYLRAGVVDDDKHSGYP